MDAEGTLSASSWDFTQTGQEAKHVAKTPSLVEAQSNAGMLQRIETWTCHPHCHCRCSQTEECRIFVSFKCHVNSDPPPPCDVKVNPSPPGEHALLDSRQPLTKCDCHEKTLGHMSGSKCLTLTLW